MNYGEVFYKIRNNHAITARTMGQVLGISDNLYIRYEKEVKPMPIKYLNETCRYFDISIDYAFGLTSKEKYYVSAKPIDRKVAGARLKEFRKDNNITQEALAKFLNTTHSVISAYESGKTLILTSFLYDICKKYKISPGYLLGIVDTPKYLQ